MVHCHVLFRGQITCGLLLSVFYHHTDAFSTNALLSVATHSSGLGSRPLAMQTSALPLQKRSSSTTTRTHRVSFPSGRSGVLNLAANTALFGSAVNGGFDGDKGKKENKDEEEDKPITIHSSDDRTQNKAAGMGEDNIYRLSSFYAT